MGMLVCCNRKEKSEFEKRLSFDRNLIETKEPELVCHLSEDSIPIGQISDFTLLNDTSLLVVDGRMAFLYHISGTFVKLFGISGRAGGEMLSPNRVYATSSLVYIWCSSLMKILIFDHEGHFKEELPRFDRAVKKFIVDSDNEQIYLYTSGTYDKLQGKTIDVISIYHIAEQSTKKYGEQNGEDDVLSTFSNSGGLYSDTDRLIFLHPGNLIIHNFDLISEKTVRYKIEDKTFQREAVTLRGNIVNNKRKLIDYMMKNSVVRGLYKDNGQWIIVSETGQFDFDLQKRVVESPKNRNIKLYILDSSFTPVRTVLYEYINTPHFVIYSGAMYYLNYNLDHQEQIITLYRFPLPEG
jgi:hypothetical protein